MRDGKWLPLLLLTAMAASCSQAQDDGSRKALLSCVSAIQAASSNPAVTHVPSVKDFGSGGEHYFAWPVGSGLSVPQRDRTRDTDSASCITDAAGVVTSLTINGTERPLR